MKSLTQYLSIAILLATMQPLLAATYKWVDAEGNTVYSQQPPRDAPYEVISGPKTDRYGTTSSTSSSSRSSSLKERAQQIDTERKQEQSIAAEEEKNKKLRKENCETARKNLEVYQVYRRFKDDQGNVVRMSDEDRAKKIQETKDAIKQFCD